MGAATDVDAVLKGTRENDVEVLVLDLELQGRSSIELLKTLRRGGSKICVIVFSGHSHPDMIRHTLAAGANAYVPKSGDYERLLEAIREARQPSARPVTG